MNYIFNQKKMWVHGRPDRRVFELTKTDLSAALELENRINKFMETLIAPFITQQNFANHAYDRFMAQLGGWANIGTNLRWPYQSIPQPYISKIKPIAQQLIPEFFEKY